MNTATEQTANTETRKAVAIQIPRDQLAASLETAAKNDFRYYLNGVSLEVHKGTVRLVSTTGVVLGCHVVSRGTNLPDMQAILPREFVESLLASTKGKTADNVVSLDLAPIDGGIYDITCSHNRGTQTARSVDEKYPDWRRVVPKTVSGEFAQYDFTLLAPFVKIAKHLGAKSWQLSLHRNGASDPALIVLASRPDFIGVIMGYRDPVTDDGAEAYCRDVLAD